MMDKPEPHRRLAYLYSRYPVVSQTFCDSEMLALEALGFEIDIASINPPPTTIRHERFERLQAEVFYPPPARVMQALQQRREKDGSWDEIFGGMIARHDAEYGEGFKAATRARNALYFAELFRRRGVEHFHVHFANRATHTALFIKQWAGIPFSFTPHAQDFMVDLGSDDLLRELCREAEFVVAVSDFSRDLLRKTCPDSANKIERVYNGITMVDFPQAAISSTGPLKIISIGRLIEFKGFHHLIEACAKLGEAGVDYECCVIGEGPWREKLESLANELGVGGRIEFAGVQTQEEVKRRLKASDVFALPCIVDSKGASDILPTVITESMACSLPIVSTHLVGVPEMVDDGETGILVEPGDVEALVAALKQLAGDRELARKMGRAGREKALQVFELEITAGELAEKFERLEDNRKLGRALEKETLEAALKVFGEEGGGRMVGSGNGGSDRSQQPSSPLALYLVDSWPTGNEKLASEIRYVAGYHTQEFQVLIAGMSPTAKLPVDDVFESLEFFPDGIVLEAEWHFSQGEASQVMEWRSELGSGVATEDYLIQARRALHLRRLINKRGIRHIHAARAGMALCAWIAHRLTRVGFSMSIEAEPDIGRAALDKMAGEAVLASRADFEEGDDLLELRPVDRTRRLKVGPLKAKLPGQRELPDREAVYKKWVNQLLKTFSK